MSCFGKDSFQEGGDTAYPPQAFGVVNGDGGDCHGWRRSRLNVRAGPTGFGGFSVGVHRFSSDDDSFQEMVTE